MAIKGQIEFSVQISDCREERFRGSGKGGQNRNKRDTGVRLTHEPSGVSVEAEEQRTQLQNRVEALRKLASHRKFKAWCAMEAAARREGFASLERKIDAAMKEENLRIEVTDKHVPGEVYCDVS